MMNQIRFYVGAGFQPARFIFLLIVFLLSAIALRADTHTAVNCSQAAVQAAINASSDGDTVQVPAGTSIWTTPVTITNKSITLKGMGMEDTVIIDGGTDCFLFTGGTGKSFRITGFAFDGTGLPSTKRAIKLENGSYFGFRIDHCKFINRVHSIHLYLTYSEGLIDHCGFYCMENKSTGDHAQISVSADMHSAWKRPLVFGAANAVNVEDCIFDYFGTGNADRPYMGVTHGARVVFRFNTANNGCFEAFGAYSYYTSARATVFFEAYDNILSGNCYTVFTIKGGTGNFYNNTITGNFGSTPFELTDSRAVSTSPALQYGICDGMHAIDGNLPIETGSHTGSINQTLLTCSGKTWAVNQWVGYAVWNQTDNSVGRITANTKDTITTAAGMIEGYTIIDSGTVASFNGQQMTCSGKNWQWSGLKDFCYVYNVSDNSYGKIAANGATTITAILSGGVSNAWHVGDIFQVTQAVPQSSIEKDWDTNDSFKITDGYPCLDQIGRGQDADSNNIQLQISCPLYEWSNTINGTNIDPTVNRGGTYPYSVADHIKINRDFYADTPRPDYVPYVYPHPLTLEDYPGQQHALNLQAGLLGGQVSLNWQAVAGAVSYRILRNWQQVAIVTVTGWSDTTPENRPVYMVYALDRSGKILAAEGKLIDAGSQEQVLSLAAGWNWISFNVLPADLSLNSVFSGVLINIEQVKAQAQSAIRSGGNWKNDLADMSGIGQYKMYKLKVSAVCTLNITGTAIPSATPIPLTGGWNWVAYLPTSAMSITTALASISDQVLEVKSLTQSATYNGTFWSGALTQLKPGQGYAIRMSSPGTLIYPAVGAYNHTPYLSKE